MPESIASFAEQCAARRWGALIILERSDPLHDQLTGGIALGQPLTVDLLLDIFAPTSDRREGATVVRGGHVLVAGVQLPSPDNERVAHLEHGARAAIALTEQSNAVAIHVAPATGTISFASSGQLVRNIRPEKLRHVLAWLNR
jgi:diadenylate cyclase